LRLSLRFIIPLTLALAAIAYAVVPLVDRLTLRWFARDMDMAINNPVWSLTKAPWK